MHRKTESLFATRFEARAREAFRAPGTLDEQPDAFTRDLIDSSTKYNVIDTV